MTKDRRILLNVIATYGRSVASLVFNLFTARWVLEALGQTDYGLYGVVGSLIVFVSYLNMVLSGSATRFFAYSIGEYAPADSESARCDLKAWFNTALSMHLILALLLMVIGYPVGVYAIEHWLVIPDGRMVACVNVFKVSLITVFVSVISVPFVGMFTAKQNIAELTMFEFVRILCVFVGAYMLLSATEDRLIKYAVMMMGITCFVLVLQIMFAVIKYNVCRVSFALWTDGDRVKRLLSFSFWRLFGVSGWLARSHGSAIIINLFFGPIANAAYSIATQVSTQTSALSGALTNALTPELTTVAGQGDDARMRQYALRTCKFSTLLIAVFAVPLMCECPYVLKLWLKNPPPDAATLCVMFIAAMLIDGLSTGYIIGISASGKIALAEVLCCLCLMATLPVAWCAYSMGGSLLWAGLTYVIAAVGTVVVRVLIARKMLNISVKTWTLSVVVPVIVPVFLSYSVGTTMIAIFDQSFVRLIAVSLACLGVMLVAGYYGSLDEAERAMATSKLRRFYKT